MEKWKVETFGGKSKCLKLGHLLMTQYVMLGACYCAHAHTSASLSNTDITLIWTESFKVIIAKASMKEIIKALSILRF